MQAWQSIAQTCTVLHRSEKMQYAQLPNSLLNARYLHDNYCRAALGFAYNGT